MYGCCPPHYSDNTVIVFQVGDDENNVWSKEKDSNRSVKML